MLRCLLRAMPMPRYAVLFRRRFGTTIRCRCCFQQKSAMRPPIVATAATCRYRYKHAAAATPSLRRYVAYDATPLITAPRAMRALREKVSVTTMSRHIASTSAAALLL